MKKIILGIAVSLLLISSVSAQVLKKMGVNNTLWSGAGLPTGKCGDSDRPDFRWVGLIDTFQARADIKQFTVDGMLAWGALTNWTKDHVEDFTIVNTDLQQFRFMNEHVYSNSYYLNFLVHPFEGFDAGFGTKLSWSVGPSPSKDGQAWDYTAHVIQGDFATGSDNRGMLPAKNVVAGYVRYANNYASKAIGVRYKYKDIFHIGAAIPDGFNTDRPAANFGGSVQPVDFLLIAAAYEGAFIDNGNVYTGATIKLSDSFIIDGYFAYDGIGQKAESPNVIWGTGGGVYIKFEKINLAIRPEAGFSAYRHGDYTNAFYTGGRVQWDITKELHLGCWASGAWGAEYTKWHDKDYWDYERTKNWTGGFIFNIRPDIAFDINEKHTIAVTTEYESIIYPDSTSRDKMLVGFFWRYKSF